MSGNQSDQKSAIVQGALNTDTSELYTSLITCLKDLAAKMQDLQHTDYTKRMQIMDEVNAFLDSLAAVSPTCEFRIAHIRRYDYRQLQSLLYELIKDPNIELELKRTKILALQENHKAQMLQTSQQLRAALEEKDDKTYKAHKANVDSMPHDKMRSLGDLVEGLLNVHYLVPLEEELYGGFTARPLPKLPAEENSYDELLRSKYGDTIYQTPTKR